ncbi:MAG TPA: deoxynucleoside kinase [bacterium]|nr:deoxynucleoside kinase [bacterium]
MDKPRHIVVEGPIGVGKTSLVSLLAERLKARAIFERPEENPFLEGFYRDKKRYAFQTQLFFLVSRYRQQRELIQQDLFARNTVCDYMFAKDKIFAHLNLSDDERRLYGQIYEILEREVVTPDLVIYLVADPRILMERIQRRNFRYERPLTIDYLEELTAAYSKFFFAYDASPLLVVNTSDIDFVYNPDDFEALVQQVTSHRRGTKQFIPLGSG